MMINLLGSYSVGSAIWRHCQSFSDLGAKWSHSRHGHWETIDDHIRIERLEDISWDQGMVHSRIFVRFQARKVFLSYVDHFAENRSMSVRKGCSNKIDSTYYWWTMRSVWKISSFQIDIVIEAGFTRRTFVTPLPSTCQRTSPPRFPIYVSDVLEFVYFIANLFVRVCPWIS